MKAPFEHLWFYLGDHAADVASYTFAIGLFSFVVYFFQFLSSVPHRGERSDHEWRLYAVSTLLVFAIAGFNVLTNAVLSAGDPLSGYLRARLLYLFSLPSAPLFLETICVIFLPNVGCTYAYPRRRRHLSTSSVTPPTMRAPRHFREAGAAFLTWFLTYYPAGAIRSLTHVLRELRAREVHRVRAACQVMCDLLVLYSEILFFYVIAAVLAPPLGLPWFHDSIPWFTYAYDHGPHSHARYYPSGGPLLMGWGALSLVATATILLASSRSWGEPRPPGVPWARKLFALVAFMHTACGLGQGFVGYDSRMGFPFSVYTSILLVGGLVTVMMSELNRMSGRFEGVSLSETIVASTGHTIVNLVSEVEPSEALYHRMIFTELPASFREDTWRPQFLELLEARAATSAAALRRISQAGVRLFGFRRAPTRGPAPFDVQNALQRLCAQVPAARFSPIAGPSRYARIELVWSAELFEQLVVTLLLNAEDSLRRRADDAEVAKGWTGMIEVGAEYRPAAFRYSLRVKVRDNGMGLSAPRASHLGTVSPDPSSTKGYGLFFARRMMEWMGGNLDIRAEPLEFFEVVLEFSGDRVQVA